MGTRGEHRTGLGSDGEQRQAAVVRDWVRTEGTRRLADDGWNEEIREEV